MEDFYDILERQRVIADSITSVEINFKKDSESRKTEEYLKTRIDTIDTLWEEFDKNDGKLSGAPDKTHEYFTNDVYMEMKIRADKIRTMISSYASTTFATTNKDSKVMELFNEQKANFRAFQRTLNNIDIDKINEKWEMEDELRNLQTRWNIIDTLHLKIDNLMQGSTGDYESSYVVYEKKYRLTKKALNQKISATSHLHQSTPQMEIPTFYGDYSQWPTFLDLYKSAIHDNSILSSAQKMQHLKGKLKGEAQRLIQHLNVSAENYLAAWDLLNRRYNNDHLLFTRHIEIFLNQPSIQKQTSSEIKKLHDTTVECIHAIHNLSIDTNTWDPILVHLLTKKLDPMTLSDYKESRKSPRDLASLEEFITFLEHKFTALEPLGKKERESIPTTSKQFSFKPRESFNLNPKRSSYFNKPISFNTHNNADCVLCNTNHALYQCKKFESMPPEIKLKTVTKNGMCKNCLYVHERNICNSNKTCKICHGRHNTLLHEAVNDLPTPQEPRAMHLPTQQSRIYSRETSSNHVTNDNGETLLTTALIRVRAIDNTFMTLRALLDQGSQITLITENAAQRLGLPRQRLNASVTGVGVNVKKGKGKLQLECKSTHDDFTFMTDALIMPQLINNLPNNSFDKTNYSHIQHIQLADPEYNISKPIDILLDARVYSEIIMSGLIKGTEEQPVAQQTKLGWILCGNVKSTFHCNVVINDIEEIANYWEIEDISIESDNMTRQEQFCEQLYASTTRRLPDGRYVVRLPMQRGFETKLGQSKSKAIAQFHHLEEKLTKDCKLRNDYRKFMNDYIELGHMKVCATKLGPMCYLPHHGVHKEDSTTTQLRVVFNASSKTSTGYSLNDLMECGKKLQHDIQDLLIRWRTYQFVYTADCEKMYRCILIHEDQQHLQKIVWRDDPHNLLREYQLCTVTYGMKAAPFLAMRTMAQLATDDAEKYPLAAKVLLKDFYVDDLLSGSNTIDEARDIQHQLINMLQGAGINLRKWSSNTPQLLSDLSPDQINQSSIDIKNVASTKALGLQWSPVTDTFRFNYTDKHSEQIKCTKRKLLSDISKIFDPLGWLSPVTVRAKILFQNVWLAGIDWDTEVPKEIQHEWMKLRDDLHKIDKFQIPRWIGNMTQPFELHGFCDASEKVYACVIYLKSIDNDGKITTKIVAAKTKLAPRKKTLTLPRLELSGALLLSKLMAKILRALPQESIPVYGWTDSLVVLGWLQGNPTRWKTFVANRTTEILDIMPASCWRHINSQNNAADCATRGLCTNQLTLHTLWWEGPSCIKNDIPTDIEKIDIPIIEAKNQPKTCAVLTSSTIIEEILDKYSSLSRIIRIISYVSCFITNLRYRVTSHSQTAGRAHDTLGIVQESSINTSYLTTSEIENAYNIISKVVQGQEFQQDIIDIKDKGRISSKSHLLNLNPYLDDKNILRVGFEEFSTLLAQIEACLNSRPLYAMTENSEDEYLTPGHFLIGGPLLSVPTTGNDAMSSKTRWQLTEKMAQDFWKKWSSDYLHHLQTRRKWNQPMKNVEKNDIVLIKEDNLPPAKWAMGRVTQTHPGKDGYVRVVTLRSRGKESQRPVIKLAPLPIQNSEESNVADTGVTSDTVPQRTRKQFHRKKPGFLTSVLLLLLTLITPSLQHMVKIDTIENDNMLYFDKISDVKIVQDEWKMVIYYNMITYWNSIDMINKYVDLLNRSCNNNPACTPTISQFEHELKEIRHYNDLLTSDHSKRNRRGLINGVGYLTNSLFGILDDRFAEKYQKDIETIQKREDHIFNLYKNQTSIIEAHNNILQRNEHIMTKQLTSLGKTLHNMSADVNIAQTTSFRALHSMSIVSSMMAADVTISNLRRIQDTLVDTITDIYHGRLNVHLLPPEQIQQQLNIISGHLQDDLTLSTDNIRDLYGLIHIQTKVTKKSVIMEIGIPLLNRDQFELDEIINIPQKRSNYTIYTTTGTRYIAINLKKDAVIPMTESDLSACIRHTNDKMLCPLNHPIYTLKVGESICDMKLMISHNNKPYCEPVAKQCTDKWIKLHTRDAWLYSCCAECPIITVCLDGVDTQILKRTGLIVIPQGCAIKGESFVIHSHYDYRSQMYVQQDTQMEVPVISPINHIIKTSLSTDIDIDTENHDSDFHDISQKINWMKEQNLEQFTSNVNIHYITVYSILGVLILTTMTIVLCKLKRRWQLRTAKTDVQLEEVTADAAATPTRTRPELQAPTTSGDTQRTATAPTPNKRSISFRDILS